MAQTRLDFPKFHWIDVINPTAEELQKLAKDYGLHATSVQDCLQPEHLPKFESINEVNFVVLRAYDVHCIRHADSVQELTRKIAIFYNPEFILTVHRKEQPYIQALKEKWSKRSGDSITSQHIVADIWNDVIKSYEKPTMDCLDTVEVVEEEIFGAGTRRRFHMKKGYYLKRKVSVFKRMLRATVEPFNRVSAGADANLAPHFQNAKELSEALYFYCDDVLETINSLLNLHISLASQKTNEASRRTNEVMRVLTIFSCFFLPINFIASIYGMNFQFLPETQWHYGYFYALGMMALVSLVIFLWFRRRGWLHPSSRKHLPS